MGFVEARWSPTPEAAPEESPPPPPAVAHAAAALKRSADKVQSVLAEERRIEIDGATLFIESGLVLSHFRVPDENDSRDLLFYLLLKQSEGADTHSLQLHLSQRAGETWRSQQLIWHESTDSDFTSLSQANFTTAGANILRLRVPSQGCSGKSERSIYFSAAAISTLLLDFESSAQTPQGELDIELTFAQHEASKSKGSLQILIGDNRSLSLAFHPRGRAIAAR